MSQESCRSLPDGSPRPSVWSLYLEERRVLDEREAERSKSQIDAVLIFAGLFSATVAAFIIESYKNLNVDPEDTTAVLLARISQQLSNASIPATLPAPALFEPTNNNVNVNVLWFTSLACSLTAALGAIILQQCARGYRTRQLNYQRISQSSHHTQARIHAYLLRGAERWLLADAADYLGALIHSSLFLFLAGLVIFLSDINRTVYYVMLVVTVTVASFHFFLSVLPIVYPGFPYSTPFTKPLAALFKFSATAAIHAYVMPFLIASRVFDRDFTTRFAGPVDIIFKRVNTPLPIVVARKSKPLDKDILLRTMHMLQTNNDGLETFFTALPSFLQSDLAKDPQGATFAMLMFNDIYEVDASFHDLFARLLRQCVDETSQTSQDPARIRRALSAMTAVWYIIKELRSEYPKLFWWDDVFAGDVESAVGAQGHGSPISALMALKNDRVHAVALAAHSLVALAVHISHEQIRRHPTMDVAYSGPSISSYVRQYMNCPEDLRKYCDEYGSLVCNAGLIYTPRFIENILPHLLAAPSDWNPSMTWHVVDVIAREIEPRQADMPVRDAFIKLWRTLSALEERHRREKALDPNIGKRLQRLLGAMRRIHDALAEVQSPGQEETTLQEMNSQLE